MKSTQIKKLTIGLILLPALVLAGCQQPSVEKAEVKAEKSETEACKNLAKLKQSIATLAAVTPSSTVGDVKKAQKDVTQETDALKQSLAEVDKAKSKVLEAAKEDLEKTIKTLPDKDTLAQAATAIQPKAAAVEAARVQLSAQINCPSSP